MVSCISASEFKKLVQAGKINDLIDVRTPMEFQELHIDVARNEPLDRLDAKAIQAARNGAVDEPLYVICRSGSRGRQACEKFVAEGIANVINVEGGTIACEAAGVSVVRGRKTISLERQVRIAAGLLVLVGSVLGFLCIPTGSAWLRLLAQDLHLLE
ncbi:MAG: rhodanese-like domain-containing protein [Pirellulaceae bacterium]|nr:rhodanese-like domain-containing protein [Pirellulaceae bacterium]